MEYTKLDLQQLAIDKHKEYVDGRPYPHIILDNVFETRVLMGVLREWKSLSNKFNDSDQKKHASKLENDFGAFTKDLMHEFNALPFLNFLSTITGIKNLIPDPYFVGGGLHEIKKGGLLGMHADFNIHPQTKLDRRLNVLIYLNDNWKDEYGGHFEMWDGSKKGQYNKKILPTFNRMVIFSTTSTSLHGHPNPLTCPNDRSRKSIALYYYSNGRPEEEKREEHTTLFVNKPPLKRVLRTKIRNTVKIWAPKLLKG